MSDRIFHHRRCDARTFYKGRVKSDGSLPSFQCSRYITADTLEALEAKAKAYGWGKAEERDLCEQCFSNVRRDGL